jgi:transcriptional regulator with XRE-family HTH domain
MDDQRFGTVIRTLRIRRRLTQADLARLCGVSRATISRAERGHLEALSVRTIRSIAAALDVRSISRPAGEPATSTGC